MDTVRPPASTTATVCAAASWRLHLRASQRSGGLIGWIAPMSGQVPTTTLQPTARSRRTASPRCRTAAARRRHVGDVVAADQDDRHLGLVLQGGVHLVRQARPTSSRPRRAGAAGPGGAGGGTRRWRAARRASPAAGARRTRRPMESPRITMLSGLPGNFGPYSPSPRGGGASAIGMIRRASAAWRRSRASDSPADADHRAGHAARDAAGQLDPPPVLVGDGLHVLPMRSPWMPTVDSRLTRRCDNWLVSAATRGAEPSCLVDGKGIDMAKTLKRTAAFTALARALMSGSRGGPSIGKRLAALPRMLRPPPRASTTAACGCCCWPRPPRTWCRRST